jgi:cytochrome b561
MTTAEAARTPERQALEAHPAFDPATIAMHWVTAALVLGLFAAGWSIGAAKDAGTAKLLLMVHRSLGVTVWAVTAARACWRLTGARVPPLPKSLPQVQRLAARINEYGLYLLLLVQPVTGAAQSLYRGKAFDLLLWQVPALVARDKALVHRFHEIHEWGAWALAALIGLHAAAALFHALVRGDGVMQTMAPMMRRRIVAAKGSRKPLR